MSVIHFWNKAIMQRNWYSDKQSEKSCLTVNFRISTSAVVHFLKETVHYLIKNNLIIHSQITLHLSNSKSYLNQIHVQGSKGLFFKL